MTRYLIAIGVFCAIVAGAYVKGRADCSAKYDYAAIKEDRDALRILLANTELAHKADAEKLAQSEAKLRDLKEKAETHADNLADPDRICFEPADGLPDLFRTSR